MTEKNLLKAERVAYILEELQARYPNPPIPLAHKDPYTLLVAVLLSAQCTDERVNKVTPALWQLADNPFDMAKKSVEDIQNIIRPCGLSPQKSKAIKTLSEILVADYDGIVPEDMEALETLPGVGHKTAGVVMAQAFGVPSFPVDTHIHRLAQRWGLTNGRNVAQTEKDLKRLFPKACWNDLHLQIIYYGRDFCTARGCDGTVCPICTTCYPNRKKPKLVKKP
ncbi:endonuclease III [Pseudoalteromonas luteoviolacea S2607]|uniref:endonuclease III n=1 Tax=Pseudoalteromonas luteoviolacea TaxID=43657 RepID=UPI0007B0AB6C|nr:endonuclease III [Pseudoalteromonas luteoviolacea]KZN28975.1 endonuclease III [Pseudoalteromonas luteoviolacea S2607]